jgi:hypothetical protein
MTSNWPSRLKGNPKYKTIKATDAKVPMVRIQTKTPSTGACHWSKRRNQVD